MGTSVLSYTQRAHAAPCAIPLPVGTPPSSSRTWGEGCRLGPLGEPGGDAGGRPHPGATQSCSSCWRGAPGHSSRPCPADGAAALSTWEVTHHTSQRAVTWSSCDTCAHACAGEPRSEPGPTLPFLSFPQHFSSLCHSGIIFFPPFSAHFHLSPADNFPDLSSACSAEGGEEGVFAPSPSFPYTSSAPAALHSTSYRADKNKHVFVCVRLSGLQRG